MGCHESIISSAVNYPRWLRLRTGDATAYVMFIFPVDIPLEVGETRNFLTASSYSSFTKDFIQVMPEMEDDMIEMKCVINIKYEYSSPNPVSLQRHTELL